MKSIIVILSTLFIAIASIPVFAETLWCPRALPDSFKQEDIFDDGILPAPLWKIDSIKEESAQSSSDETYHADTFTFSASDNITDYANYREWHLVTVACNGYFFENGRKYSIATSFEASVTPGPTGGCKKSDENDAAFDCE